MARYNKDNFCKALLNSSDFLNNITLTDDVHEQVNILNTIFNSFLYQVATKITKYIYRPPAPWTGREIQGNMMYRDNSRTHLKLDLHNTQLSNNYKEEKKHVQLLKAKWIYNHNNFRLSKGKISQVWGNSRGVVADSKRNNIFITYQGVTKIWTARRRILSTSLLTWKEEFLRGTDRTLLSIILTPSTYE